MENDWTKVLGFPGYRVYKQEIDEEHKHLKLWIRRKRGNRSLICAGCGRRVHQMHEVYEREIRDLLSSILRLGPLRSSNLAPLLIDILRHLGRRSKLRPAQIQPVKLITDRKSTRLNS